MIGQTISHYKITAKLGEGGMGEVYLATDTTLDRPVALKFLPASLQKDPEARERLIREAKAASRLNHKNILTIHSVERAEGGDFIVMEYVEGKSLKEILESGDELPMDQILRLALQICDGLSAAHEHGVIHRDIKPANILVTPKGQVKITDFGLATWRGARQLTKEGTTVGTAGYMSPEQVQGIPTDHRSDLFSVGVVLYELIARRQPFNGDHDAAIAYSILNESPEPLARFKANIPTGIQEVVTRALEKDPSMRYQSSADMLADLKRSRRDSDGSRPSAVMSATHRATPKKSYLKYLVATSVVFVAALVILILKPFKFEVTSEQKATASENSLAVMYFDNLVDATDNDKTAQMVTSLLITGLSESQYLQVTSRQRLYDILAQLGKEDAKTVDHSTATKVAERANVKWMVTGEIIQVQPRVVLTAEVSEVATGRSVTAQKVAGEAGEDMFAVVDRLAAAIRGNVALPDNAANEAAKPVAEVTTHSPEAYRAYLEGLDYDYKFYAAEARKSFEKAVSYDSTFAMAHLHLSILNTGGAPSPDDVRSARRAKQFADRATWKEQRVIAAVNADIENRTAEGIAELDQLLERYPEEKDALAMKANALGRLGRTHDAITTLEKIVSIDPADKLAYNQLAYSYDLAGDFDRSIAAINKYVALASDEANPYDSRADLYTYNGKLDLAIDSYREALIRKPDFYPSALKMGFAFLFQEDYRRADSIFRALASSSDRDLRSEGRAALILVPARQGKFAEAMEVTNEGMAADRMEEYRGFWSVKKLAMRAALMNAQADPKGALAVFGQYQAQNKRMFPEDLVNERPWEVELLLAAGDTVGARKVTDELRRDIAATDSTQMRSYWMAEARMAFSAGRFDEAIRLLELIPPAQASNRRFDERYLLGGAYLRSGAADKAVRILEKAALTYDVSHSEEPVDNVRIHYLLGLAFEQSGSKDKAVQEFKRFLDIWKNADPGIKELDDARARLAKLQST